MPRPKSLIPKLCIDRSRNRAFCKVDGKFVALGPAGSVESQEAYGKLLASLARGETFEAAEASTKSKPKSSALTLNELMLRFRTDELPRYSTAEQWCLKSATRVAREMFGATLADEFGPLKLRLVRDAMVAKGWSRSFTNKQVKRLRMIMRWGVSWELVSQTVADSLSTVKALEPGETDAPESRARRAVSDVDLKLVRSKLCKPVYQDLFDLMLLCGARPGELVGLSVGDLDRTGELWRVDLAKHKTSHKGKARTLFFNVTAQAILLKYLKAYPDAPLFNTTRMLFGNAVKRACELAFELPQERFDRQVLKLVTGK
jgi:integrase